MSTPFFPISVFVTIFVFFTCLLDTPVDIRVGSIHSSVLEILASITFMTALIHRKTKKSQIWAGFIAVIITSSIPFFVGISSYELRHVVRDFAQISYISFFMVGYYIYLKKYLLPDTFTKYLLWTAVTLSSIFLFDLWYFKSTALVELQYSWRIIIAFSFLFVFAGLIGVPGISKINKPVSIAALVVLLLYAVQIRTRAFLVMLCCGAALIALGSFFIKKDRKHLYRLLLSGFLVVSIIGILAATTNWVDLFSSEESSLVRLQSLQAQEYEKDVTANYRLVSWAMALTGFIESPLWGQGLGSYLYLDPWLSGLFDDYPAAMIHNTFLQILYNGGLIHLAGYMLLFYRVLTSSGWLGPDTSERERTGTRLFLISFFISFQVYSAFGVTLFKITDALLIWFIAGFLCGSARSDRCHFTRLFSPIHPHSNKAESSRICNQNES